MKMITAGLDLPRNVYGIRCLIAVHWLLISNDSFVVASLKYCISAIAACLS